MNTNDEILLTHHAAALLKCSVRKVRQLIKEGELPARRRGKRNEGSYEILKSSCVAYMHQLHQNVSVKADCRDKSKQRFKTCQSNYDTMSGTVISFRQAVNELDRVLAQPIKN